MREISLEELAQKVSEAKESLWDKAQANGRSVKVYLHWTAGSYYSKFDDYHINIDKDGAIFISTEDLSETLSHTYYRNSGSIGVTLCCCAGATDSDLGDQPPTEAQLNAMAQVTSVLCDGLGIPVDKTHVLTHGEAADNEDGLDLYYPDYNGYPNNMYGPKHSCERWDLEYLGTSDSPVFDPYGNKGYRRGGDIIREMAANGTSYTSTPDLTAPNGLQYSENDIKYLMKNGYTMQAAIDYLSKSERYNGFNYSALDPSMLKAPNGSTYSENDIKYLLKNGYALKDALYTLSQSPKYKD